MKRIMVIGCSGSGKSTFSKKIQEITGLPLFHLDQYFWLPGWQKRPDKEWQSRARSIREKEKWIIDGSFGSTLDERLSLSDTVIFLDRSTLICLIRVIKRILMHNGKTRASMAPGCPEKLDLEFLHYIASYNLLRKRSLLKKLKKMETSKSIVILKSDMSYERYLDGLKINFA